MRRLLPVAAGLLGSLAFFRNAIFSGFDKVMGIRFDTGLVVFLHEHWWKVLNRNASWLSPNFMYPSTKTLGFTDTYFLDTLLYAPLRALGVEPFLAFQLTAILLGWIGYAGWFLVLRRWIGATVGIAIVGALIATYGNALFAQATHPQLLAVHWLPWVGLTLWFALHAHGRKKIALGFATGAEFALIAWTAFYVAWFVAVAILIFLLVRVALGRTTWVFASFSAHRSMLASGLVGTVVGLIPFAFTYLPVIADRRERSLENGLTYATTLTDVLRVGESNLAWGWVVGEPPGGIFGREFILGFPVLFLCIWAAVVVFNFRRRDHVGIGLSVVTIFLLVLPLKIGARSVWEIAYNLLPGATAIRVISRSWIVIVPIVVLLAARTWVSHVDRSRLPRWVVVLGIAFLLFEQVSWSTSWDVDRRDMLAFAEAIGEPPNDCEAFFLFTDDPEGPFNPTHIDAMMIAMRYGIPTVNGYSGLLPNNYDIKVGSTEYPNQVDTWLRTNGISRGLCVADRTTGTWSPWPLPSS